MPTAEEKKLIEDGWSPEELSLRKKMLKGVAVVISVRKKGLHPKLLEWAKAMGLHTYIGRYSQFTGHTQSIWHNPYKLQGEDRGSTLERYEEYLTGNPGLMRYLGELKGHALGCWCKPNACHGDVLVKYINGLPDDAPKIPLPPGKYELIKPVEEKGTPDD